MRCNQETFDSLKEVFGKDCYDAEARLEWEDTQPMLTLNGEKHPVDKSTWFSLGQTSSMHCSCIPCLSSGPLEVIAVKSAQGDEYALVAINNKEHAGKQACGYSYSPLTLESFASQ
jgi:hypothetical protein